MSVTNRQPARRPIIRRILPAVAAAFLLLAPVAAAAAPSGDDLPNGRLGWRWTPDPPSAPVSRESQIAWDVAKYGGGALLALWIIRKLATSD